MTLDVTIVCLIYFLSFEVHSLVVDYDYVVNTYILFPKEYEIPRGRSIRADSTINWLFLVSLSIVFLYFMNTVVNPTGNCFLDKALVRDLLHTDWTVWCQLQPNGYICDDNYGLKHKFYYDVLLKDCKSAPVGACMHNFNKFETITECHDTCQDYGEHRIPEDLAPKIYCRLQPDFGECNSYYPRFYYDVTLGRCKGFSFSGCGGNKNRFATYQLCSAICRPIVEYKIEEKRKDKK